MKNRNNIFRQVLIRLGLIFIAFFIWACNRSPASHQGLLPKGIDDRIFAEVEEGDKSVRRSQQSSSWRRSSRRRSSSSNIEEEVSEEEVSEEEVREFNISQLSQVSVLMARGDYEEAAALSKGISPQLSALIDAGNYTQASLLLSQMLAYL